MAKHQSNLRYIFKIHSTRLRRTKWNLNLSIPEAINNNELVALADSTTIRFINDKRDIDQEANEIIKKIREIKKLNTTLENRRKIKSLYHSLYDTLFIKDYICVIIDKNKDFDRMNSKLGFKINGIKFKRLLATNGGVKKATIVYVSETIYPRLTSLIDNGRNLEKPFVPAKLESYKSLTCSASIPVSDPKGILVINDCETEFLSDVILLDDTITQYPTLTYEKDYKIKLIENDGYGLIHPELSQKWTEELEKDGCFISAGFCIRNSFCKGMLFTFDYKDFGFNYSDTYIVKDAWGNLKDVRETQIVLTTSMLKLWDSYDCIEDYIDNCKINGYSFSVTKMIPKELENERNLNYQFIQSYDFTDEDLEELILPTINDINDVLGKDIDKSLLFLRGIHLNEHTYYDLLEPNFIKALMVDRHMINDPFVRAKIHNMIKKRINEAKIGVLKVKGNFSIISGDPFSLCQSMFGLEVTGLLKAGEFYSSYWNNKGVDKVVAYRPPMTCHNNIRILRLKNTKDMKYWYHYLNNITIFNSWDTTKHALNGCDCDGDQILTTNNPVLLRTTKELDAVVCIQKTVKKIVVTEEDLIQANKNGFGDEIGSTTNKITTMIDILSNFSKDSEEYKELEYRIICGQNYQQNAIDKMKGIISKPMPKEWYDFFTAREKDNSDFLMRILVDKKPYFFIYNYAYLMKRYKTYIKNTNKNCIMRFGIEVKDILEKKPENRTEEEKLFLHFYYLKMPIFDTNSTMNRICRRVEKEFDKFKSTLKQLEFDYKYLMSDKKYSKTSYYKVKELHNEYTKKMILNSLTNLSKKIRMTKEEKQLNKIIFTQDFKRRALEICNDMDELCNIVIEMCYKTTNSKQFAWDVCGEQIIRNLLKKNNYMINYPIQDDNGSIEFGGMRFSLCNEKIIDDEETLL